MAKHTDLKSLFSAIANAIRGKDGSTAAIVADEFPTRIENLATHEQEDAIITRELSGEYVNDRVPYIGEHAFQRNMYLNTFRSKSVTRLKAYAFYGCNALEKAIFTSLNTVEESAFAGCHFLEMITFGADYPYTITIREKAFASCVELRCFVLPRVLSAVPMLAGGAFENSAIEHGTGYIYVPRSMVETYKASQSWSTYASQIRAIEDYTVDGTITGELDETKI